MKPLKFIMVFSLLGCLDYHAVAQTDTQKISKVINYVQKKHRTVDSFLNLLKAKPSPQDVSSYKVESSSISSVEISRTPLYPSTSKNTGSPIKIPNTSCEAIPVGYQASFNELSAYFSNEQKIFPGAAFKISKLIDKSYDPYLGSGSRNPMKITTNIVVDSSNDITRTLSQFDVASYNEQWVPLLAPKLRNGSTPADYSASIYTVESLNQIEQDQKLVNEIGVDVKLKVPIPNTPVNMNASNQLSISNESLNQMTSSIKKNYCVIKFEQIFYSTTASTPNYGPLFTGTVDPDVVYVSRVDYGRIFMMTLESEASKQQLVNAINYKLNNTASVGVDVVGIPIGGEVKTTYSQNEINNFNNLFTNSSMRISCFQIGGDVIFTGSDFEAAIQRIKETTSFGPRNIGSPINYSLEFADTHGTAWINVNNKYATNNCGINYDVKYDVELELDQIKVSNVQDLDGTEDLYGEIKFTWLKGGNREVNNDLVFWQKSRDEASTNNYRNGSYPVNSKKKLITDLTLDELNNTTLYIGGRLHDEEKPLAQQYDKIFQLMEASTKDGDFGKAKFYFRDQPETLKSIEKLKPNGNYQALKFGNNSFLELTFCESGKPEDGKTVFLFKVNIRPH